MRRQTHPIGAAVFGILLVGFGILLCIAWVAGILALFIQDLPLGISAEGWRTSPKGGPIMFVVLVPPLAYFALRMGHGIMQAVREQRRRSERVK
jgi:hypothetical protein